MANYKPRLEMFIPNVNARELGKHGFTYNEISEAYSDKTFAGAFDFLADKGYHIAIVKEGDRYYALCEKIPYMREKTESDEWHTAACRAIMRASNALSQTSLDEFCQSFQTPTDDKEEIIGEMYSILQIAHDFIEDGGFGIELGNLNDNLLSAYIVSFDTSLFLCSKNMNGEKTVAELHNLNDLDLLHKILSIMCERVD